jgi:aminomethyltransferase
MSRKSQPSDRDAASGLSMVDLEQKADFIGKEALARIKQEGQAQAGGRRARGGERRRVQRRLDGCFPVEHRGAHVGRVTSAYHPRLDKNIG